MKKTLIVLAIVTLALSCAFAGTWKLKATAGADFCFEKNLNTKTSDRYLGFPIVIGASYTAEGAKMGTFADLSIEPWAKRGVEIDNNAPDFAITAGLTYSTPIMDKLDFNSTVGLTVSCGNDKIIAEEISEINIWDVTFGIESTNTATYKITDKVSVGGGLMLGMDFACLNGGEGCETAFQRGFICFFAAPVATVTVNL